MSKIAVIAHDKFKPNLLDFLKQKKSWFFGREIVATGKTAEFIEDGGLNMPFFTLIKDVMGVIFKLLK